jgi:kynureninase
MRATSTWCGSQAGGATRKQSLSDAARPPTIAGAEGWQFPICRFFAAPLHRFAALFDKAGCLRLRAKSVRLTGYLESLCARSSQIRLTILTPADPEARGCQLSLAAPANIDEAHKCSTRSPPPASSATGASQT